jgi:hypothetical protein
VNNKKYSKDDYDEKLKKSIDKQFKTILIESGKDMTINSGKLSFAHYIIFGKLQVQVSHPDKPVSACCN